MDLARIGVIYGIVAAVAFAAAGAAHADDRGKGNGPSSGAAAQPATIAPWNPNAKLQPTPTWISATSGNVTDPSKWVDGIVPGPLDPMLFGLEPSSAIYIVSFPNFASNYGSITIANQRPIFDLFAVDAPGGVTAAGALTVGGSQDGNAAELRVVGNPLNAQHIVVGGPLGTGKGTINLQPNAPLHSIDGIVIERTGVVNGVGAMAGDGIELTNRGVLAPGVAGVRPFPGRITIDGNYMQTTTGTLRIDIAGPPSPGAPMHDELVVTGMASLGGTLVVDLLDGFVPAEGDTYEILTAQFFNPDSPTFQSIYMPALPGGLVMMVEYVIPEGNGDSSVLLHVGTLDDLISFGAASQFDAGGSGVPSGIVVADMVDAPCPPGSPPGCAVKANDIVTLLRSTNPSLPGAAFVLVNVSGDATSFASLQLTVGLDPRDVLVADLTRNGANDIAVANAGSNDVTIWYNDGEGGFTPIARDIDVGGSPVAIASGNFRGEFIAGLPVIDLAVVTVSPHALVELQNDGTGGFLVIDPVALPAPPTAIVSADFNIDGFDDVAVGDVLGEVRVFLSTVGPGASAGSFPDNPDQSIPTGRETVSMSVEDIDNTKDNDIIVIGRGADLEGGPAGSGDELGLLSILLNDGGNFSDALSVELDGPPRSLTVWDINDNSKPDIAVVIEDPNAGPVIRVFRNDLDDNDMTLVFSLEPQMFGLGKEPVFVTHGDMNGNGQGDMLALNASGLVGGGPGGGPAGGRGNGGPAGEPSASVSLWLNTSGPAAPPDPGCVKGMGFWMNHPDAWPVTELDLGSVTYTQAQLIQILKQPVKGNGLLILAKQLIAAKLNIAGGAIAPPEVLAIIEVADLLIGGTVVPPIGGGHLHPSVGSPLAEVLAEFNEGDSANGPPACNRR